MLTTLNSCNQKPSIHQLSIEEPIYLECGKKLDKVVLSYSSWGELNDYKDNVVWICHPLTCSSDPTEWWPEVIGWDKVITPEKYFIVCVNVLGSCYGSTGPCSESISGKYYGLDFPIVTVKDIVLSHELIRKYLKIHSIFLGIGASFGGQQLIQWMTNKPDLFQNACIAGANAKQSAWAKAFSETQRMAIEADSTFYLQTSESGKKGLAAARALAVLSYRSYLTYRQTQEDDEKNLIDNFKASSYQQYIGKKFTERFDALSYWYLTKAMDSHNISRSDLTIEDALSQIKTNTLLLVMTGDVLFHQEEMQHIDHYLPKSSLLEILSTHGHDGLLACEKDIAIVLEKFIYTSNEI